MSLEIQLLAVVVAAYFLYNLLTKTDTPKIKNLPQVPGIPILGNLRQLGEYHATVMQNWALSGKYGPVFQVLMGNKRIVVANTYASVKELWISNQSALISRPTFHTFHNVVSTSQGFTIGTSPWDESCKNRRKAAATALNKPAVQSYMPIIDLEASQLIRDIWKFDKKDDVDQDPKEQFLRFALSISLTLNYGINLDPKSEEDNKLFHEIVATEGAISLFRSTSNNWADYVPLMRWFTWEKNTDAKSWRSRRDTYMNYLLTRLKGDIANGTDRPCITGNIIKDPEAKLNDEELKSICLTMVSAGLDTIPANLLQGVAYLSTPHGQLIQQEAIAEINRVYPDGDAWEKSLVEAEKVEYVMAFVKEVLRYYTVIPICLPRKSTREIVWENAKIPAGTIFYMNAYAADYDPEVFTSPHTFNPHRYLKSSDNNITGTPHFSYGAGSRMCVGSHLANRELYTAFIRIFTSFKILPPVDIVKHGADVDAIRSNSKPTALVIDPKSFRAKFEVRNEADLERWLSEAAERERLTK